MMSKRLSAKRVAIKIISLLKANGYVIRPYEGEVSCCVIETAPNKCNGACISCPARYGEMTVIEDL